MSEFIFIRHGESESNILSDLIGGRSNHTPLTERGQREPDVNLVRRPNTDTPLCWRNRYFRVELVYEVR